MTVAISIKKMLELVDNSMIYYRHENIPGGDLRISITSQCNMRCFYCHNEGQGEFDNEFISVDDFRKVVHIGKKFGAYKIRLTGGEPLLHPEVFRLAEILKRDFEIRNIGLNTNGLLLTKKVARKLLNVGVDTVVVGLDYANSNISKRSSKGMQSAEIMDKIIDAKKVGLNVQIASTYDNVDEENIINIARWCRDNSMLLKVLEVCDNQIATEPSAHFLKLIVKMIDEFELKVGKTIPLEELYGVNEDGMKILFFHSHCRIRGCKECAHMHMRVTASGKAKPCLLRSDTEYDLLGDEAELSMCRAIHNLGNPPESLAK